MKDRVLRFKIKRSIGRKEYTEREKERDKCHREI
jgi:hypothetical protein